MAQNLDIRGWGILYVVSKISRPDLMDEATYMNWYDNDHIAEILQTSGIKSALRYINVNIGKVDKPYLAMYPMEDINFTQGDEFRKIKVHSKLLPGTGLCYDLADIDVRYYNLVQVYDPTMKGKGHTKIVISAQYELSNKLPEEELEKWYREEHLDQLAQTKDYLRTTRFKLVYARSNAHSRALKGLPTTDEPPPEPPTWLALHEYETEEVDMKALKELTDTPWTKKIHEGAKEAVFEVYRLSKAHGENDWFHSVKM